MRVIGCLDEQLPAREDSGAPARINDRCSERLDDDGGPSDVRAGRKLFAMVECRRLELAVEVDRMRMLRLRTDRIDDTRRRQTGAGAPDRFDAGRHNL